MFYCFINASSVSSEDGYLRLFTDIPAYPKVGLNAQPSAEPQ